jgi:hypothetical protein
MTLTPTEQEWVAAFTERMRDHGRAPSLAPNDWYDGMEMPDAYGRCLGWTDIVIDNCVMLDIGAFVDSSVTRVGVLHNQLFHLQPADRKLTCRSLTGSAIEQAIAAADWMDTVLRRPIDRRTWSPVAQEWCFGDDGTPLVASGASAERSGQPSDVAIDVGRHLTGPVRPYVGLIWIEDTPGIRLTVHAESALDAQRLVMERFGDGHVISLWNEDDANRPR